MALMDLKSDLSWYGKKAPGFSPNADKTDTRFSNDASSPSVIVSGFDNKGDVLPPVSKLAADSFIIDDVTFSDRGSASRKAQLGVGTKFPISYDGTIHTFDKVRTGFNFENKYSDSYGVKFKNSGLADTYTANSPIDDMYGKFNLREDAHDPYGYAKPPFILRGIQQEDNSDPQQWGTPGVFDIPRGGVVTAAERAALDAVRIGKFLIRPPGISFLAKQVGLQLTNPNTEGVDGTAKTNTFLTKLYDPLSSITNAVGGTLGLRTDRHFPPLVRSDQSTYEGVLKKRAAAGLEAETSQNRLVKIRKELLAGGGGLPGSGALKLFSKIAAKVSGRSGEPITSLTGITGPGSLLGIGATTIRRTTTSPDLTVIDTLAEARKDAVGDLDSRGGRKTITKRNIDFRNQGADYNAEDDNATHPALENGFIGAIEDSEFNGGGRNEPDATLNEVDHTGYKTNPYEKLKSQAADRPTLSTGLNNDFLSDDVNTYENTEESSRILKTSAYEVGDTKQSGNEEGQKTDNSGPLAPNEKGYYKVLGYANLQRDNVRSFGNAKSGLGKQYASDTTLEGKYGYLSYNPNRSKIESQADPIQSLDSEDYGDIKDLINFKFQALRTTDSLDSPSEDPIIFRAFINSLSDAFAPSWNENNDQGRADAKIMLESWSRSISLDFIVPVQSQDELSACWSKLERLAKLTYPIYASSGFTGTYVKTTIGDLYRGEAMYVTDLSYDWDNETPWELSSGNQLPFYTTVSMTLGWIGKQRPEYDTHVFTYNATT